MRSMAPVTAQGPSFRATSSRPHPICPFLAVRSISNVCGEGYSELNDAGARMEKAARLAAKIVLDTIGIYASGDSPASRNPA